MSMDKLRAEIAESMRKHEIDAALIQREIDQHNMRMMAVKAQISTLQDVLGTMDEMAETETPFDVPTGERFGTGRAPRRDIKSAVLQAVSDYTKAKGIGPRLENVVEGAAILLGSELSESATRRALDSLIGQSKMRLHDGRYAPGGAVETPANFAAPPLAAK